MVRLPFLRIPRLRYDRVMWVVFLMGTVLFLMSAVARKKATASQETEVYVRPLANGELMITDSDVKGAIMKAFGNNLEGIPVSELEVERLEKSLEEDPFVEDADAYVDHKNTIHVDIDQRQPLLRILDNNGGNYYLDLAGKKMPPSKNFAARVLVATGNIPPYSNDFLDKKRNTLKDLYTLTHRILDDDFLKTFVQQIYVNNQGDFVLVPLIGDQKIVLGSLNRLTSKIERLKIFYREGIAYSGWQKYKTINLKYSGQVVCKK